MKIIVADGVKKMFKQGVKYSFTPLGTYGGGKKPEIIRFNDDSPKVLRIMESTSKKGRDASALLKDGCNVEDVFLPLQMGMGIANMLGSSKRSFWGDWDQAYTYSDGNFAPHYSESDRLEFARAQAEKGGLVVPKGVSDANLAGCFALTMQQGLINYYVAQLYTNQPESARLLSGLRNAEGVGGGYRTLLSRTRGWLPFNSLSNIFGGVAGAVHIVQDNTASGLKEYGLLVKENIKAGMSVGEAKEKALTQVAQAFAMTEACVNNAGLVTLEVAKKVPQFGNCLGGILNNLTFDLDVFEEVFVHRDSALINALESTRISIDIGGDRVEISYPQGAGRKIFASGKASVKQDVAMAEESLGASNQLLTTKIEEIIV